MIWTLIFEKDFQQITAGEKIYLYYRTRHENNWPVFNLPIRPCPNRTTESIVSLSLWFLSGLNAKMRTL